jgi:nucleoside 2-deoxyribosyltransferase
MNGNLAYIIMPVGSDRAFESKRAVLQASGHRQGWMMHFPMSTTVQTDESGTREEHFELTEVITTMKKASLVIADLSLERPSCYYEPGVAQTLGRPTLLLASVGTAIHQVAHRDRVHFMTA